MIRRKEMDKKLYRVKDLSQVLSMGESSIWKLAADPNSNFPKPIKISTRLTAWLAIDIDRWLKDHSDLLIKKRGGK